MPNLVDTIQKIVQHELQKIRIGELGVVTSVFPHADDGDKDNYECNVKLKNSGLELRKVPVATGHIGTVAIPNVGDLVLLSFVKGDVNQAIITSRLYNDEDRPPANKPNEIIHRLPLHAEDDKAIKLELRNIEDNTPPRELLLEMPEKIKMQIVDTKVYLQVGETKVTIVQEGDSDGKLTIETGKSKMTMNQDGDIVVESEAKLEIKTKADTIITSEGKLDLISKGDMSLSGPNINIKSDQATKIEAGTDGTFKIGASGKIETGAPLTIKSGATAKIEASATMDIKGAMVNIN